MTVTNYFILDMCEFHDSQVMEMSNSSSSIFTDFISADGKLVGN